MYLPDIKTASYSPRPAAAIRCFSLLRDGRTSNAGGSARASINVMQMSKQSTFKKTGDYAVMIIHAKSGI